MKVQFTYDISYREASQLVVNRLSQLGPLPNGAQPFISPTSPIGEIFRYRVVGPPGYSVTDLKTIQDWILLRRLKSVPGVIDVTTWGGKSKTFDITVDLDKLLAYGITLKQVLDALNGANINVGANTVNLGPQSAVIRSVGQIRTMADIGHTMLTVRDGSPVLVSDVATITVGNEPRLGVAGHDNDDDIVQGIVLMRRGAETLPTLRAVEKEVDRINGSDLLPPGVRIQRVYDRSVLVDVTTSTVLHNMVMGVCLVFLIQWLFLGDLRSALIVSATIPFALLFAVVVLVLSGELANLLSMGAIDFGIIVDATVIMVENIYRHLAETSAGHVPRSALATPRGLSGKLATIYHASGEVTQAIFFSATIIIAGFLPLFTLSGVEGHIFGPMAKTYAYALSGGLLATFTVSPALAAVLLPDKVSETETIIVRLLRRLYRRVIDRVLARRGFTLALGGGLLACAVLAASSVGLEFLPKLEEGNIWLRAALPPSVSLDEGNVYANRMRRLVKSFPEVETVITQHGRPDDGTDPDGFSNVEFFVPLKPADKWRKGLAKEQLIAEMGDALRKGFPGDDLRLLAVHPGQRAGGGVRHRRGKRHQDHRSRSRDAAQDRRRDPRRAGEGARHHRHPGAAAARPAHHQDRHRPPARRALRPVARRHQRHHPGRRRRPGGGRPLRGRQRPPLPHAGAAGAAIPPEHGGAPAHRHRRARAERRRGPGAAAPRWPISACRPAPSTSTASSRSAISR